MPKALIFINGQAPTQFPTIKDDEWVVCTDGAYNYLKNVPLKIDVLIGDLDSLIGETEEIKAQEIVEAYDQNYTDFQKALRYVSEKGITEVAVYGGAGKEQDHFLGNLTAALEFKTRLKIIFHEDKYRFWFAEKVEKLTMTEGKIISLYPYPKATNIVTSGVKYPLHREDLDIVNRIGIRNEAISKEVSISFDEGELLLFVYH